MTDRLRDYKRQYDQAAHERDAHKAALLRVEKRGAYELTPAVWDLVERARERTHAIEDVVAAGTSGEYKRRVVLSQMQKDYPAAAKKDVAMAVELALR